MIRRAFRLGIGPGHIASEVDDEIAFHVDMRTRKLVALGMPEDAARREAIRQFGDLPRIRTSCVSLDEDRERSMNRIRHADELGQDVSFAARALRRDPAFALVAVLTLALGIGANTAIFTLINAVMLRPIPVHAPQELVSIGDPARVNSMHRGSPTSDILSYGLYRDIVERNHVLTGLAATGTSDRLDVRVGASHDTPEHPTGRFVTANYFSVLGVPAALGRVFGASEEGTEPVSPVTVISDEYWTSRFARDPAIIGKTLSVNNVALTIIGVTPPGFEGEVVGSRYHLWLPLSMHAAIRPLDPPLSDRVTSWLLGIGRVAPGTNKAQAITAVRQTVHQAMVDNASATDLHDVKADVPPVGDGAHGFSRIRSSYSGPLFTMLAGVGLLLLIICANVANLLLARAIARTQEFSVRLALGAGRGRLVRQLLTESAVLAMAGAFVGLALAWAGSRVLLTLAADGGSAIPLGVALDGRVLLFTLGLSMLAVGLFGLLPAVRAAGLDLASSLRARGVTGGLGARGQRFPIGTVMIASQIALSLVLLMGAGLLVSSLRQLETVAVGMDRDHILMITVSSGERGYSAASINQITANLQRRFAQLPGVVAASYSSNGVFSGSESRTNVAVPNWVGKNDDDSAAYTDQIGPQYVAALGGRLISGRDMAPQDVRPGALHVMLVNQSFSRFYFGDKPALGQIVRLDDTIPTTVVGVVADVRDHALDAAPERRFYTPYSADASVPVGGFELNFEIRTSGDPALLVVPAQHAVTAEDPALHFDDVLPLKVSMSRSVAEQRMLARVASGFGMLALFLSAIGLYGVMTYAVTRRTGELGLRIALGAEPRRLIAMVVGDAFRLVLAGIVIGAPLAFFASRLLRSQMQQARADWRAVVGALAVLTVSALIAALIPALRAAKVPPLAALHHQ
jgi:putative ABC transport system permease protein